MSLTSQPAIAAPSSKSGKTGAGVATPDRVTDTGKDLPKGWRTSSDRAVTLAPDARGVHVLAADSAQAYRWRRVTTLSEPGFGGDLWTGDYCLTDRSHAVVVYAPRGFTNTEELMERGAFVAIVDVGTGAVKKLAVNASLAYFDPACDPVAHTAAITQFKDGRTRLLTVDSHGRTTPAITMRGEVTSAVPAGDRLLAASGHTVVSISRGGKAGVVATASGTPYAARLGAGLLGGHRLLDADPRPEVERDPHLQREIAINDDDPSKPENWFAAAWDYNSGFNKPGAASNWGLGWYNNPANPIYPPSRHPFLDGNTYSDAAKPQQWPYEEKVMGWAAWPIDTGHSYDDFGNEQNPGDPGYSSAGYAAAWWLTDQNRTAVKPPLDTFCDASNACDVSAPPTCEVDHTGDPNCDTPHWWNKSAAWKSDCDSTCGHGQIRYVTLTREPGIANPSPPPCDASALPSGTVVVDEVSSGISEARCPANPFHNQGTFTWSFPADSTGTTRLGRTCGRSAVASTGTTGSPTAASPTTGTTSWRPRVRGSRAACPRICTRSRRTCPISAARPSRRSTRSTTATATPTRVP